MKAIPLLRAAGVSTHANFIVGFPGETLETVAESVSLIEEAKPDFFRAQLWYADPVTPIWKQKDKYGVKGAAFNWSHNTMDYQTACDLVEQMFINVKNSVWLQQHGFEQWSCFYLKRKGMTMDQIKTFLKCFNAIVKEKLINPENKEIPASLLEDLKVSARFDQSDKPISIPINSVDVFSTEAFLF
jgi:hypothetical protein